MNQPQINVTPLIDVLLVLLIIFMIVTPVKPSGFKVKVPQEPLNAVPAEPHPDTLVVVIDQNAELSVNRDKGLGTVNDTQKLIEHLSNIFRQRTDNYGLSASGSGRIPRHVFIKAPDSIGYGSVAKVVDAVKLAGADPIALQIDVLN